MAPYSDFNGYVTSDVPLANTRTRFRKLKYFLSTLARSELLAILTATSLVVEMILASKFEQERLVPIAFGGCPYPTSAVIRAE